MSRYKKGYTPYPSGLYKWLVDNGKTPRNYDKKRRKEKRKRAKLARRRRR